MALYHRPREHHDPTLTGRTWHNGSALLPLILAAAIVVALITMFYPGNNGRVGDTNNAGPSVKTVTPSPSPSTSPPVPNPTPTTEPRPTQAPIQ
jgi:hypothetical protein